jgi:hypothetical protein
LDDERIDLAEPSFIPLAQDEAARAVRLLAVLIKAARSQLPDSTPPPPRESRSSEDLAAGSPPIPTQRGKVASAEAAGGGR